MCKQRVHLLLFPARSHDACPVPHFLYGRDTVYINPSCPWWKWMFSSVLFESLAKKKLIINNKITMIVKCHNLPFNIQEISSNCSRWELLWSRNLFLRNSVLEITITRRNKCDNNGSFFSDRNIFGIHLQSIRSHLSVSSLVASPAHENCHFFKFMIKHVPLSAKTRRRLSPVR